MSEEQIDASAITATKLEFSAPNQDMFEVMTSIDTGFLDDKGQPLKGFVREITSVDQLNQQKLDLQSKIDTINAKIKALGAV